MTAAVDPSVRKRALFALFLVSAFNYIDRSILSILQIPIKADLGLSDTQMGALTGLSFALFYATLSLPVARLADRTSRRILVVASLAIWSAMTGVSGLAIGFGTLVFFRIGVAIGEAGSVPASVSLLADYYPPTHRATAMAAWGLALPVGLMLGYGATGWLASTIGWRLSFAVIGAAGLLLAPLALALIKEPSRGRFEAAGTRVGTVPLRAALVFLWREKAFRYVVLATMLHGFSQYAMMTWNAPFFTRSHDLSLQQVSLLMAALSGGGGAAGMFLGGFLADRLAIRDQRWRIWAMALTVGATVPVALVQYLVASTGLSIAMAAIAALLMIAYYGPVLAVTQSLVPAQMRAFSNAVLLLIFNLFGLGLGPWCTGMLCDLLVHQFGVGDNGLRYALSLSLMSSVAGAILFVHAARLYRVAMAREKPPEIPDPRPMFAAPVLGKG
ncbi:MAG: MFS transporter [Rhodospirillaceae bacterium]|nr:MAG: MFS transporter [Rhodospirillaceae bacterium]